MSQQVTITFEGDVVSGIDAFVADRTSPPVGTMTQAEAVNVALRDWLMGQGYLALPGSSDRIIPALDAAGA